MDMDKEEQPKRSKGRRNRLVTRNDWIGCSLVSLLLTLSNTRQQGISLTGNPAEWLQTFVGKLAVIVIFWVVVKGLFHWLTKKRPVS
jgi:sorbitol-specific phosphotransferase system component IIBC